MSNGVFCQGSEVKRINRFEVSIALYTISRKQQLSSEHFRTTTEMKYKEYKKNAAWVFAYQSPESSAAKIIGLQSNPTPINVRSEIKRTWKFDQLFNIMKHRNHHTQLNSITRENADPHHGEADHAAPNFVLQETIQLHQWSKPWNCALINNAHVSATAWLLCYTPITNGVGKIGQIWHSIATIL